MDGEDELLADNNILACQLNMHCENDKRRHPFYQWRGTKRGTQGEDEEPVTTRSCNIRSLHLAWIHATSDGILLAFCVSIFSNIEERISDKLGSFNASTQRTSLCSEWHGSISVGNSR